ncbi:MAG: hypothetical protein LIP09_00800 [Bacteroidales bacterium]|nr:hypothetical protein [Bacteroidales bacterium]
MAKERGGVRNVPAESNAFAKRQSEVAQMRMSGHYSAVKMYNSGWVAIQKSEAKHFRSEIEVAIFLAKKGYKVTLKSEAGNVKTPDGYVFNYSFEQSTPKSRSGVVGAYQAIDHGADKIRKDWTANRNKPDYKPLKIDVALIYDKYKKFSRSDIEQGLKMFEQKEKRIRYKKIIVISSKGNVHVHRHNDKK